MKYVIEIPDNVARELKLIADNVGFKKVEDMYVNYSREVILAARADAAASKARSEAVSQSTDLDKLIPGRRDNS